MRPRWPWHHNGITTVERLTATQVVLASGNRYLRKNGRRVGATTYDTNELLPVNHPRVRDARMRGWIRHLRSKVDELCKDPKGGEAEALTVLHEVEKAVAAVRARIAALAREG